jgi:type VII secretion-associated serine protease mycosin
VCVRRLISFVLAGVALALPVAVPAQATPKPNDQEWWFDSLAIQEKAWVYTKGKGVTVAVIDTGINASLPEFRGGVVLPGKDFENGGDGRTDYDSHDGHGTGMASLIAGQGGGRSGIVGVAPDARILALKGSVGADSGNAAIRYAADHGAKVISISQGAGTDQGKCWEAEQDALIYAVQHDAVVMVAAGNSGDRGNPIEAPAACGGAVAVGAYDHNGDPWIQTARQPYVMVSGPGHDVSSLGKDGRLYQYGDGTSQATAIAAGEVALLRARFPNDSAKQIMQRITNTATDLGPPGKDDQLGYGGLSLRTAMTAKVPSDAPNPIWDRYEAAVAQRKAEVAEEEAGDRAVVEASRRKPDSGPSGLLLGAGAAGLVFLVGIIVAVAAVARRRRPTG